jgi:hypothetical protein
MVHGEPAGYNIPLLSKALLGFVEGDAVSLQIETWSDSARLVQIRGFTHWGTISIDHTTNADRSKATTNHELPDFPIMLQAKTTDSPVRRGQLYIKATIQLAGFDVVCLFANYISDTHYPCYPFGHNENSIDGAGYLHQVTVANVAVGSEFTIPCPPNTRWKVISFTFNYTASSTAANRYIFLSQDPSGNSHILCKVTPVIVANDAKTITLIPGYAIDETAFDANGYVRRPLPINTILYGGMSLNSYTLGKATDDEISSLSLIVEEWIEE